MQSLQDIDWGTWQGKDSATLTFVIKDEQILLIRKKRGLGAGKINGPGGRLEPGETLLECAIREVQEELCITPVNPEFFGESRFQFTDGYSIHVHTYVARDFTGSPEETDEAIPLWFSLDQIPYEEMWADDIVWLPEMLKGNKFKGRYLFDGDRMLDYHLEIF
ncbi:8-oxo-dGTP diphosphatase [Endozoicomonas sp. YOMI1]|uniref:8-oxo-dGTP diphosphatase n=1 Tax=Endozoicomonas sp. YOMI1 TaxID=2828739 RepID=UPI0021476AB6|nr:8-oxo-dGTP diphosphatase [Endozoicomonas sp. YOMI1]